MVQKGLFYSAILIGTYLVVSHATQAGTLLKSGAGAYSTVARTLQGR